ncbi:MAG TPA: hypothetical protein VH142_05975 [Polyangiaceae bacterium]|jgi:tRNA/tmRNA/rRNA uracil-C5-methylase (TrmA/RlmC/RlmD family)|nr:hypothetical protein [Polyangiaceae bacterium]
MSLVCPHRPPCPGCPRLGAPDVAPPAIAAVEQLAREHDIAPPRIVRGRAVAFRHRARLAVRGRATSPKIGIFELGTHRVVDIPRCLVHHPLINDVARELKRAMIATGATTYSDDAHRGLVRYVQVVVERRTETAQVVVVTNESEPASSAPLFDALVARLGERLHSAWWNGNPARANTILGPLFRLMVGEPAVEERIGEARVFYPPGAFGQNNLDLADEVVREAHARVPAGARLLELYAGVGPLGLGLVARSRSVVFNELSTDSLRGLDLGIAALAPELQARVQVVRGPATAAISEIPGADVVIVDPPRRGLDVEVTDALALHPPKRLVYLSCGLPSFLNDAGALTQSKSLSLTELVVFDLFPHTEHVEVLAVFDRAATGDAASLAIPAGH